MTKNFITSNIAQSWELGFDKKIIVYSNKLSKEKISFMEEKNDLILEDYSIDEISIKWHSPHCVTITQKEPNYGLYYTVFKKSEIRTPLKDIIYLL